MFQLIQNVQLPTNYQSFSLKSYCSYHVLQVTPISFNVEWSRSNHRQWKGKVPCLQTLKFVIIEIIWQSCSPFIFLVTTSLKWKFPVVSLEKFPHHQWPFCSAQLWPSFSALNAQRMREICSFPSGQYWAHCVKRSGGIFATNLTVLDYHDDEDYMCGNVSFCDACYRNADSKNCLIAFEPICWTEWAFTACVIHKLLLMMSRAVIKPASCLDHPRPMVFQA